MRISDWSSDVCSSDLADLRGEVELGDGFFDKLRIRAGFADYKHTEFEGDEVGTVFTNQGIEGRIELAQNDRGGWRGASRSEEHTSELQSLMRISYAVFCLKKKTHKNTKINNKIQQT